MKNTKKTIRTLAALLALATLPACGDAAAPVDSGAENSGGGYYC